MTDKILGQNDTMEMFYSKSLEQILKIYVSCLCVLTACDSSFE